MRIHFFTASLHFDLRSLEYFFDDDGLLLARADRYDADRYTDELGDAFEVFLAESRKLIIASDIGDLLLPAFEGLIDRGDLFSRNFRSAGYSSISLPSYS